MAKPRPRTRTTLARNLAVLMEMHGWSYRALAARCGVSPRQIGNILNEDSSCTTETADAIASAFGLEGWHLLLPDLPAELVDSPTIGRLVRAFIGADADGRELLVRMAQREAANN
jgi:transcriptional regulator with XRE-family HTH domain